MLLNCGAGEDSLRVPWTMRSNQSILKEINPEGLMLKLKLQYFGYEPTHWKIPWCSARLKAGGEGDDRRWDVWMASQTQWIWVWANSRRWWGTGRPHVLHSTGSQSQTRLSDWIELKKLYSVTLAVVAMVVVWFSEWRWGVSLIYNAVFIVNW